MLVYLCRYCCANWAAMVHFQMIERDHLSKVKESYFVHLGFTIRTVVGLLFLAAVFLNYVTNLLGCFHPHKIEANFFVNANHFYICC